MKKLLLFLVLCMPLLTFTVVGATGYDHGDQKPKSCKPHEYENEGKGLLHRKKRCHKEEPKPCEYNLKLHGGDKECVPPEQPEVPQVPEAPEVPKQPETPIVTPQVLPAATVEVQAGAVVEFQGK